MSRGRDPDLVHERRRLASDLADDLSLAGDRFAQPRRMLTAQETSLNPGEVTSNLDELGHVVSVAASKLV